jgi:hypothetical protein
MEGTHVFIVNGVKGSDEKGTDSYGLPISLFLIGEFSPNLDGI